MTEANVTHQSSKDDNITISNRCQTVTPKEDRSVQNCNILENAKISNTSLKNTTVLDLPQNETNSLFNKINISTTAPSVNKIQSSDTLLKYIYKTSEKTDDTEKIKGNTKNSLNRKKRSEINEENKYLVPASFSYAAVHNKEREELLAEPEIKANVIKNADLADFNIETIHMNSPTAGTAFHNYKNVETTSNTNKYGQRHDEDKTYKNSNEHIESITQRVPDTSLENSSREDTTRDDTGRDDTSPEITSREDTRRDDIRRDDTRWEDTSHEDTKQKNTRREDTSQEELNNQLSIKVAKDKNSQESYEKSEENSEENKNNESLENSKEFVKSKIKPEKDSSRYESPNRDFKNISSDESNESNEKYISLINEKLSNNSKGRSLIDSNESSNEKFLDSGDTSLKPLKAESSKHADSSIENSSELSYIGDKTNYFNGKYLNSDSKSGGFLVDSIENSEEIPQIHINDDEVKPVIELYNEENNDEVSKEIQDGPQSLPLKGNNKGSAEKNNFKKGDEVRDVKQQFERIPLNYKHTDKEHKNNGTYDSILETRTNYSNEAEDNTSDKPPVKDDKYDENLNFKFDDVAVKLPEIKLPDDILDYAYEPIHRNEDESKTSYPVYTNKQWSPQPYKTDSDTYDLDLDLYQKNKKHLKNKDRLRHKYSRKENENDDSQEDEDEDEDLYEKFVRERFGKRESFTKRSEQLNARPEVENHELFKTIHNVLKKTKDIQKEADKSGDPNAGYLWTLEYGEKLR